MRVSLKASMNAHHTEPMKTELSCLLLTVDDRQDFRLEADRTVFASSEAARAWLDAQFIALECEPLRASGKVLLADKVLTVAQAAGQQCWSDADWGRTFTAAATTALGKPLVTIDLRSNTVGY